MTISCNGRGNPNDHDRSRCQRRDPIDRDTELNRAERLAGYIALNASELSPPAIFYRLPFRNVCRDFRQNRFRVEVGNVPENIAADILGLDKPTQTYGLYSGGASLEVKRGAVEKLVYPVSGGIIKG